MELLNTVLPTLHLSPTEYCMPAAMEKSCFCWAESTKERNHVIYH